MKKKSTLPDYHDWKTEKVRVTDLFLDPKNIRIQEVEKPSQAALISDLFVNEDAMQILRSVASYGFFPDEKLVGVKTGSKITVIDGNRRVAALKMMVRPSILPTKEVEVKAILRDVTGFPSKVDVVIAPDRNAVRRLLASKHTQNTRKAWSTLRQAYFYRAELERGRTVKQLRKDYPGANIDKFLKYINIHRIAKSITYDDEQITKKVHNERSFPATTMARLYEDKQVREFLGFDFDADGEVRIKIAKREFEKGFKRIVQDVVDKVVDSRKLNKEADRLKYLKSIPKEHVPKRSKRAKEITSKNFTEKSPVVTSRRTKLAPKDILMTLPAAGVKRMLIELQGINYRKFPNASHDLLRSFLECSLKRYLSHCQVVVKPDGRSRFIMLDAVLKKFKAEMDRIGNKELSQVTQRIRTDDTMGSYSAQFLNATNHNPSVFAKAEDVEIAWDMMESLFRFVLDPRDPE